MIMNIHECIEEFLGSILSIINVALSCCVLSPFYSCSLKAHILNVRGDYISSGGSKYFSYLSVRNPQAAT